MRRPREDIFRNNITLITVVGNELLYFSTSEVPNVMVLQGDHQIRSGLYWFKWSCPIIHSYLAIPESGQMQLRDIIHAAQPQRMLEKCLLATALWHFPCGTIIVLAPFLVIGAFLRNKTSTISEDGCPYIVGLDMRNRWLLCHRYQA